MAALVALTCDTAAARDLGIGLAAPLSGDAALLGQQVLDGARAAVASRADTVRLEIADSRCDAEGGAAAARHFVQRAVPVAVGFLCTEAIEAALPILTEAGIPVVTPGVRTNALTDGRARTGWQVFRLAPRADDEEKAVARILTERWREALFAIVDDGTIYGRELAESLRAEAELAGLEPVFVDTYRPQLDNQIGLVGRLRRAGATHVFVGGDRSDIALIARDAAELDYALTIAGGEALRAPGGEVPLADGVLMVGLPDWPDIAAPDSLAAFEALGTEPDGYAVPAFAAVEVAAAAAHAAAEGERPPAEVLAARRFESALGPLRFGADGELQRPLYGLYRYRDGRFVEVE
ncbi:branched-chain amino acid ABC transporter substrate-binding protein [Aquibium sp. A9E412]|uniref:branched-chain amino acid ABC transporter substrate-binding protein n=1 Tax=Aquibium sp. A9E412 TaxID=2976767 RepID=UPI0025B16C01|nr:branched-chain amino acid ABC transporter substrate-binding protein [Aquibium sp. A9E412]MDN2567867.1 branched-chain amino acid ABC transporter substrate-binding protein [Aquibium sp. A9E412]